MFWRNFTLASLLACLAFGALPARSAEAPVEEVKKFVSDQVVPWIKDKIVIDAIKEQNQKNASLGAADVETLDKQWRGEIDKTDKPLINALMNNALSKFLAGKKAASGGLITEIFVMDNKGLNVGQSDVTSDYWQGDEAKWQKTFTVGASAVFVDEIEKDESTQRLQVQISVSIADPATGAVIGAATIGVDVTLLLS